MKRFLSILIASSLVLSSLVLSAGAYIMPQEEVISVKGDSPVINEPTPEMMEAMIKKVRPRIDVPKEFEDFIWNFNAGSYYSLPSWNFTWTDNKTGEIYIKCDSDGNIKQYSFYDYESKYAPVLPSASPEELLPIAKEFISKTAPYIKDGSLVLDRINHATLYNHTYTYVFVRYENGITVPDETVSVSVNHLTKKVESMHALYNDGIEFEGAKEIISEEKAKEILSENQKMVLSYRLKTEYDDEGKLKSRTAFLVYTPEKGYVSVDAVTGEVYTERNTWTVASKNTMAGGSAGNIMFDSTMKEESAETEDGAPEYMLSEKELEQLAVLENLISKDEAIKAVTDNEHLYINPDATAVNAKLTKQNYRILPLTSDGEEKKDFYVWCIDFSSPYEENKFYYAHMYAVVDAQTGELLSFNSSTPDHYYYTESGIAVPEINYTDEEAVEIAESFIKLVQPEKAKNIRHSDTWGLSAIKYIENETGARTPVYGNKRFTFVRTNEGIDFDYNSFNMAVDLVSGKITSYSYEWYDDVVFESPKDAIGDKEALMALYSYDGFGLNYEVNSDYTYNKYLADEKEGALIDYDALYDTHTYSRAVYSAYNPGTNIIRALDGKMITYSGEEYKEREPYSYSDIDGHWAEETILRFAYANIGFEGGEFRPGDKITADELRDIYNSCRLYTVEEILDGEETVTRMDAVKFIISALGYSKIAKLENVFITDFADNLELKSGDVGYAAIARGFGLIQGDGESFFPYESLTRAQALTLAENVIASGMLER